jgi:hypothetical protein
MRNALRLLKGEGAEVVEVISLARKMVINTNGSTSGDVTWGFKK